jgi:hypothetical protein
MSTNLVAEFLLGPIALLVNLLEAGFFPATTSQLVEHVASLLGTMMYVVAGGTVVGILRGE